MPIPGSNLLKKAMTVIAAQTVTYNQATGKTKNDVGQYVTTYAAGVSVRGSFQPVPRRLYAQYGLDFQKNYYTLYVPQNVIDIRRDVSPDQVHFGGRKFTCISANDWFAMDGWVGVLCVEVI